MSYASALAQLTATVRAAYGGGDWLERLARSKRVPPSAVTLDIVEAYWTRRALDIVNSWLAKLTDQELEWRLAFQQEVLVGLGDGALGLKRAEDGLEWALKEVGRRGELTDDERISRREPQERDGRLFVAAAHPLVPR